MEERYAIYGAYRKSDGSIEVIQISTRANSWDEVRRRLSVFTRKPPNNASYFIGEFKE